MKELLVKKNVIKIYYILVILLVFSFTSTIAIWTDFNTAPDEGMRYKLCMWFFNNSGLPDGRDESIRNEIWGLSYGFTPYLGSLFSGIFMRISSIFSSSDRAILISARFVSVLSIVGYACMCIKISNKLFSKFYLKSFFIALSVFMPQILYLGGYINEDSLSLFSVSIIVYSWILGLDEKWSIKSCILLAIGDSICLLSYYNAYAWVLFSFFIYVFSCYFHKIKLQDFIIKGLLVLVIVLTLSSWFFINNYILYNGDIFGFATQKEFAEQNSVETLKPSNRLTYLNQNKSIFDMIFGGTDWVGMTTRSYIGVFSGMSMFLSLKKYFIYFSILLIGLFGACYTFISLRSEKLNKQKNVIRLENVELWGSNIRKTWFGILIAAVLVTILISIIYSYSSDYQPQGRYIISISIAISYFVTLGIYNLFLAITKRNTICKVCFYAVTLGLMLLPFPIVYSIVVAL